MASVQAAPLTARRRSRGSGSTRHPQALRLDRGAARRRSRPVARRGAGAGRRQCRRQVDADQDHRRRLRARRRPHRARRRAGRLHHAGRGAGAAHRDGLPGPLACATRSTSPATCSSAASRCGACSGCRCSTRRRMLGRGKAASGRAGHPHPQSARARWPSSPAGSGSRSRSAALPPSSRSVLIMDEPTSALAVAEVEAVLRLIRRLAEARRRRSILITHRLQDLFRVCDRIAVMYEGLKVAERRIGETDLEDLVGLIVGEKAERCAGRHDAERGAPSAGRRAAPGRLRSWPRHRCSASPPSSLLMAADLRARHRRVPLPGQPAQPAAPVGTAADRGGGHDLRHHHRRHRPLGRLDRGAGQRAGGDPRCRRACPGRSWCC